MKSTEFTPCGEKILVKPVELEQGEATTESGIVFDLEQNNSIINRPTTGTVISVGKDVKEIITGMYIQWLEISGEDIELQDGNFLVIREESVLGYKNV